MYKPLNNQSGAILVISLVLLLMLTLIGITGTQTTSLEEKMAGNLRDKDLAFQTAESAMLMAEASLDTLPAFNDDGGGGFYSDTTPINLTSSAVLKDDFWTANPVAISSITGLGNDIAPPVYIIQKLRSACFNKPCPPNVNKTPYRIIVRATGRSTNAVVILQSIYVP